MEPSRPGAAGACRVVRPTPTAAPAPGASGFAHSRVLAWLRRRDTRALDASNEPTGIQDVLRVELGLDSLHDPPGGARIVPDGDLRFHRERRPLAGCVAPARVRY